MTPPDVNHRVPFSRRIILAALVFLLAACAQSTPPAPSNPDTPIPTGQTARIFISPTSTRVTPTSLPADNPTATLPPLPAPVTPTENASFPISVTETPSFVSKIVTGDHPGPLHDTVFKIPLGTMGLRYLGVGAPDTEISGPDALAVLPDGSFVLNDPVDNRLLRFGPTGKWIATIKLSSIGLLTVLDLRSAGEDLYVLENRFQSKNRCLVHRLSINGQLAASYELPNGMYPENGLTGIAIGGAGEILAEFEGGSRYKQIVDAQGNLAPAQIVGYPYGGRMYQVDNTGAKGANRIIVGNMRLETHLTKGFGGLSILGVLPDGSFYAIRDDVVNDQVIQVDETVHWMSADGKQLGLARVPLGESLYYVHRQLAIGLDGTVYALFPQKASIDILRLNFYTHLEPLIDGAIEPQIYLSKDRSP